MTLQLTRGKTLGDLLDSAQLTIHSRAGSHRHSIAIKAARKLETAKEQGGPSPE